MSQLGLQMSQLRLQSADMSQLGLQICQNELNYITSNIFIIYTRNSNCERHSLYKVLLQELTFSFH